MKPLSNPSTFLIIILALFLGLVGNPPRLLANGATARAGRRPPLPDQDSHPATSSAHAVQRDTRPVPRTSNLAIKVISLKKCTIHVTITNSGHGPVSRTSREKGTLTLTFSPLKAADRKRVPQTFSAPLAKLGHGRFPGPHEDLTINTRIPVLCPLTVTARLSSLSDDDGRGPRSLSRRISPDLRCQPRTQARRIRPNTTTAKPSAVRTRAAGTQTRSTAVPPGHGHTRAARLTMSPDRSFDLSIVRAYVQDSDRHLHVVLENRGKTEVPRQVMGKGRLDIRVTPQPGTGQTTTGLDINTKQMSHLNGTDTTRQLSADHMTVRLNRLTQTGTLAPGHKLDFDTGLVINTPMLVTVRLLPLNGDGLKGRKRLTHRCIPHTISRSLVAKQTSKTASRAMSGTPARRGITAHRSGSPIPARKVRHDVTTSAIKGAKTKQLVTKTVQPSRLATAAAGKTANQRQRLRTMDNEPSTRPHLKLFLNGQCLATESVANGGIQVAKIFKSGPLGASMPFVLRWVLVGAQSRDRIDRMNVAVLVSTRPNENAESFILLSENRPGELPNTLRLNIRDIFRALRQQAGIEETAGNRYRFSIHLSHARYASGRLTEHPVAAADTQSVQAASTKVHSQSEALVHRLPDTDIIIDYYVEGDSDSEDHPDPTAFPPPSLRGKHITSRELIAVQGNRVMVNKIYSRLFAFTFDAHRTEQHEIFNGTNYCRCPYFRCFCTRPSLQTLIEHWDISITDLLYGGRCVLSGEFWDENADIAISQRLISNIADTVPGQHLPANRKMILSMKEGTIGNNSVYRISARLEMRAFNTTANCLNGHTVEDCWTASEGHLSSMLDTYAAALIVSSPPVRLDLSSTGTVNDHEQDLPLPSLVLRHSLVSIPTDIFSDEGHSIQAATIREGEQVTVSWSPVQMPPSDDVGVYLSVMQYDRTRRVWTNRQDYPLSSTLLARGQARILMDLHGSQRCLRAGLYKLWLQSILGNPPSAPVYVLVNQNESHRLPHFDFRLSRLTPAPNRRGMLLTVVKESGDRFNGSLTFQVRKNHILVKEFNKDLTLPGVGEPVPVTFRLPEETDICAHEAEATYEVTLLGTDLWDERRIEGRLALQAEHRSNIAFQAATPVTVQQYDDNFGGRVVVTVHLAPRLRGRLCKQKYTIRLRVSRPGGTVIFSQDREVGIGDRRAAFHIHPVARLTNLSDGEKRLYFEALLDYEDQWTEKNEGDNVRGTWFRLH